MAVPRSMPLSVALGELNEWLGSAPPQIHASAWAGIDFCKLGLAVRLPIGGSTGAKSATSCSLATPFPAWVAVVYLDWKAARAPHPDAIIDAAAELPEIRACPVRHMAEIKRSSSGPAVETPGRARAKLRESSSHSPARSIPQRLHDGKPGGPTSTPSEARPCRGRSSCADRHGPGGATGRRCRLRP